MKLNKKKIAAIIFGLLIIGVAVWNIKFSTTRIGFLNYQVIELGQIAKSNEFSFISIREISPDNLDELNRCDMVFINGMGLRITEEQRKTIRKAADKGLPVLSTYVTNPANNIISIERKDAKLLNKYLLGGGRRNYRSMLGYVRKEIDGKLMGYGTIEPVKERTNDPFYHFNLDNPDDEDRGFTTVAAYQNYLSEHGLLKKDAPSILITGSMGDATDLTRELEQTGNTVYGVRDFLQLVESGQIDSIRPSAVINMAHGRLGDFATDYLTSENILFFSPLNVNRLVEDWEQDKMGMSGGFMSQSIVTPEIDGAIRPYALFGHYLNEEGLQELHAIPERCKQFVETINREIALKTTPNVEKKVAIYYYKGPGQSAMTAAGMEVASSLYNLLVAMKEAGYRVERLPKTVKEFESLIQQEGAVFGNYAEGATDRFIQSGKPARIDAETYQNWCCQALRSESIEELNQVNGPFPGKFMATANGELALARVEMGNVVLIPQLPAGGGTDEFKMAHGTEMAPPHPYVASYLWGRYAFQADVMIHFGTHGSLEFTPRKQVALSSLDWPDRLVGPIPHLYIYSIADVGEGMIAKRRSYATLQSYLTPPFMESNLSGIYRNLNEAFKKYNNALADNDAKGTERAAMEVKRLTVRMGIHRELRLDSVLTQPYSEEEITRIENFADELANEKITGEYYTMGEPYRTERIESSVYAMATEPIAYSMLALDKLRGRADADVEKKKAQFTQRYLKPARKLVERLLHNPSDANDELICQLASITGEELEKARKTEAMLRQPVDKLAMMMRMGSSMRAKKDTTKASDEMAEMMGKLMSKEPELSKEQKEMSRAIGELERTILNINRYRSELKDSPRKEFESLLNAMNGGFTLPSPGGDPIANPNSLPTGRNLFAINAEATPSEAACERGIRLAQNTIKLYKQRHNDSIPRKVSYTLWSGEFIESEGATIAQVLYILGVEPIRDFFGRVSDIRLIPSEELGRPRIDVVVQTSGQLRDIAASRLFLISRAVEMAAAATNEPYENFVRNGVMEAEKALLDKGLSPKEAREVSTFRVFGGVNGSYGTGITDLVQRGDRWKDASEIANIYMNNMGAFYGSEKNWEQVYQHAFEAALIHTDAVVQPRQSNTWGAMSLDHVYEFMGGMNLAVRNVTGKEPDAYLSDYRNRNHVRMQELKEAIGVESRSTILNPTYIREKMRGGASDAAGFAEIIQNTYGWNVMKPEVIDKELWDEVYNVYVQDKFQVGVRKFFEEESPAALQEITAVMLETARKGMWKANEEQINSLAALHTELVRTYKPACSRHVCDNARLREFIASHTDAEVAREYQQQVRNIREACVEKKSGVVMKKEELQSDRGKAKTGVNMVNNMAVIIFVLGAAVLFAVIVRKRRNNGKSQAKK